MQITEIKRPPKLEKRTRVAAYARVSSGKDAMLHSLSSQVSYYNQLIQDHPGWRFVRVYTDEAKTGTKDSRDGFQALIQDCKAGLIDLVLTKSISRFARNTVTLLNTVRELKNLGVNVFFEEQNIYTMSSDGELMLTLLASFAQAESQSASENQRWRILKNFEEGLPWNVVVLGYRFQDGRFVVQPTEASVVRRIYEMYLNGYGTLTIAKALNEEGIPTRIGLHWTHLAVLKILQNETYTGNLLLQKTFRENYLSKKKVANQGELAQYYAEETHEAIIDQEIFKTVQTEIQRRSDKYARREAQKKSYPFTSMIVCENCGKHYRRKVTATGPVWICDTFNTLGKAACNPKQIPEDRLELALEGIDLKTIRRITAKKNNMLEVNLINGNKLERTWKSKSRSESWTPEMREKARQKRLERVNNG